MNLLRNFRVEKSLKAETSTETVDLKGRIVSLNLDDDTYTSFLEVLVEGDKIPYLVPKSQVLKSITSV